MNFASFGFPPPILKGIRASGLTDATAIQSKAIPIIQHGNDLIGIAESGAGKTGTYLFPILVGVAMLVTLGVLFSGLIVMARGGEVNRKYGNVLMRWRVALQFTALVVLALIMLAAGK